MTKDEQVRLYLRDQVRDGYTNRFSDEDIQEIVLETQADLSRLA